MTLSTFLRASGWSAFVGGILFLIIPILFIYVSETIGAVADLIGSILVLWGLIGFYLAQMRATTVFGFISFIIAFWGTSLLVGMKWMGTFVIPDIVELAPELLDQIPPTVEVGLDLSFYLFFFGWALFIIVTAWTAILPRWGAIILLLGLVSEFIPITFFEYISQPLSGLGIAWLGYGLLTGKRETTSIEEGESF